MYLDRLSAQHMTGTQEFYIDIWVEEQRYSLDTSVHVHRHVNFNVATLRISGCQLAYTVRLIRLLIATDSNGQQEDDSEQRHYNFMINRLFMKLFKTNDIRLVHLCQDLFHFHLPSVLLQQR